MMNDQTSPTAGGQRQDPLRDTSASGWQSPSAAPRDASGLPAVPPPPAGVSGRSEGLRALLATARSDIQVGVLLAATGALFGVLGGMAWYRFAPTVWLSLPADAVSQVKTGSGLDQSSLLVTPEAKGIVSVDGYFFMVTAVAGLLLGALAFYLGRRGFGGRREDGDVPAGAGVGAWVGVLVGGILTTTMAAAIGRWISLPDPMTLLRTIADGHRYHAPVALHATGFYLTTPILSMLLFTALTAAFTKAPPLPTAQWTPYGERPGGYFAQDNPYGFTPPAMPTTGGGQPGPWPATPPTSPPTSPPAPAPTPAPTPAAQPPGAPTPGSPGNGS